MLFVLPARQSQEELEGYVQDVFGIVEKAGGKVTKKEVFTRQRLAYPINKEQQGVYIMSEFDLETNKLRSVDRDLRHTPGILRHQIVRVVIKSPEQLEIERLLKEKVASRRITEAQKVKQEEISREVEKPQEIGKKKEEKVDIEELDKKIEELLDDPLLKG